MRVSFFSLCSLIDMKKQVWSGDWGSLAASDVRVKQEEDGRPSMFIEDIGGGGGIFMADAEHDENVDDYAGMRPEAWVSRRRHALGKKEMENPVERKHKRMVKNRESAARSRARKQAYTSQMEFEISTLRKENELLMKYELFEELASKVPIECPQPLRRTFSATF